MFFQGFGAKEASSSLGRKFSEEIKFDLKRKKDFLLLQKKDFDQKLFRLKRERVCVRVRVHVCTCVDVGVCVCMCVYVSERERERD